MTKNGASGGTKAGTPRAPLGWATPAALVSSDIRRHNLALVAAHLAQHGPRSRSELADSTGLTRGAITALTASLLNAGIVRESAAELGNTSISPDKPGRQGRPRTALELHAPGVAILALQLDADVATALLTTVTGETLVRYEQPHDRPMGQPALVIDVLARVLRSALDESARLDRRVLETVVVVFAPVTAEPAHVLADTDLGWGTVDLLGELRAREPRLAFDATLSSDAPLAARAERSVLPDIDDMLYLKSNSGIGGAAIVRGQLVAGARNMAGPFGHLAIVHDGELCPCGQRGCLVTVAGPDVVLSDAGLNPLKEREGLARALEVFASDVRTGQPNAVAAWQPACRWIAHTLGLLSLSFDPAVIVLGGYWAELSDLVAAEYSKLGPTLAVTGEWGLAPIIAGTLGADAALLGAVWSAREKLMLDPMRMAAPAASVA